MNDQCILDVLWNNFYLNYIRFPSFPTNSLTYREMETKYNHLSINLINNPEASNSNIFQNIQLEANSIKNLKNVSLFTPGFMMKERILRDPDELIILKNDLIGFNRLNDIRKIVIHNNFNFIMQESLNYCQMIESCENANIHEKKKKEHDKSNEHNDFFFKKIHSNSSFGRKLEQYNPTSSNLIKLLSFTKNKLPLTSETIKRRYHLTSVSFYPGIHSNILPHNEFSVAKDNSITISRQWIENTLKEKTLSKPNLTTWEVKWISFQMICSLAQLHSTGLYHGNLSNSNFLISSTNHVYLSDISSAYKPFLVDANDVQASVNFFYNSIEHSEFKLNKTSNFYFSPERFNFSSYLKPEDEFANLSNFNVYASDIFSLGYCLAELLMPGKQVLTLSDSIALAKHFSQFGCNNTETFVFPSDIKNSYNMILKKKRKKIKWYLPYSLVNIEDTFFLQLLTLMCHPDPSQRPSACDCLSLGKKLNLFPETFYSLLYPLYVVLGNPLFKSPYMSVLLLYFNLLNFIETENDTDLSLNKKLDDKLNLKTVHSTSVFDAIMESIVMLPKYYFRGNLLNVNTSCSTPQKQNYKDSEIIHHKLKNVSELFMRKSMADTNPTDNGDANEYFGTMLSSFYNTNYYNENLGRCIRSNPYIERLVMLWKARQKQFSINDLQFSHLVDNLMSNNYFFFTMPFPFISSIEGEKMMDSLIEFWSRSFQNNIESFKKRIEIQPYHHDSLLIFLKPDKSSLVQAENLSKKMFHSFFSLKQVKHSGCSNFKPKTYMKGDISLILNILVAIVNSIYNKKTQYFAFHLLNIIGKQMRKYIDTNVILNKLLPTFLYHCYASGTYSICLSFKVMITYLGIVDWRLMPSNYLTKLLNTCYQKSLEYYPSLHTCKKVLTPLILCEYMCLGFSKVDFFTFYKALLTINKTHISIALLRSVGILSHLISFRNIEEIVLPLFITFMNSIESNIRLEFCLNILDLVKIKLKKLNIHSMILNEPSLMSSEEKHIEKILLCLIPCFEDSLTDSDELVIEASLSSLIIFFQDCFKPNRFKLYVKLNILQNWRELIKRLILKLIPLLVHSNFLISKKAQIFMRTIIEIFFEGNSFNYSTWLQDYFKESNFFSSTVKDFVLSTCINKRLRRSFLYFSGLYVNTNPNINEDCFILNDANLFLNKIIMYHCKLLNKPNSLNYIKTQVDSNFFNGFKMTSNYILRKYDNDNNTSYWKRKKQCDDSKIIFLLKYELGFNDIYASLKHLTLMNCSSNYDFFEIYMKKHIKKMTSNSRLDCLIQVNSSELSLNNCSSLNFNDDLKLTNLNTLLHLVEVKEPSKNITHNKKKIVEVDRNEKQIFSIENDKAIYSESYNKYKYVKQIRTPLNSPNFSQNGIAHRFDFKRNTSVTFHSPKIFCNSYMSSVDSISQYNSFNLNCRMLKKIFNHQKNITSDLNKAIYLETDKDGTILISGECMDNMLSGSFSSKKTLYKTSSFFHIWNSERMFKNLRHSHLETIELSNLVVPSVFKIFDSAKVIIIGTGNGNIITYSLNRPEKYQQVYHISKNNFSTKFQESNKLDSLKSIVDLVILDSYYDKITCTIHSNSIISCWDLRSSNACFYFNFPPWIGKLKSIIDSWYQHVVHICTLGGYLITFNLLYKIPIQLLRISILGKSVPILSFTKHNDVRQKCLILSLCSGRNEILVVNPFDGHIHDGFMNDDSCLTETKSIHGTFNTQLNKLGSIYPLPIPKVELINPEILYNIFDTDFNPFLGNIQSTTQNNSCNVISLWHSSNLLKTNVNSRYETSFCLAGSNDGSLRSLTTPSNVNQINVLHHSKDVKSCCFIKIPVWNNLSSMKYSDMHRYEPIYTVEKQQRWKKKSYIYGQSFPVINENILKKVYLENQLYTAQLNIPQSILDNENHSLHPIKKQKKLDCTELDFTNSITSIQVVKNYESKSLANFNINSCINNENNDSEYCNNCYNYSTVVAYKNGIINIWE